MKNTVVQTRIEDSVKNNAEKVLNALGLSINDGIRMFLNQVTIDQGMPFRPALGHYPNEETRKVIAEADAGIGVKHFDSVEALFEDLDS
jgi:addiction module antitoxin, RelB/DinJ family